MSWISPAYDLLGGPPLPHLLPPDSDSTLTIENGVHFVCFARMYVHVQQEMRPVATYTLSEGRVQLVSQPPVAPSKPPRRPLPEADAEFGEALFVRRRDASAYWFILLFSLPILALHLSMGPMQGGSILFAIGLMLSLGGAFGIANARLTLVFYQQGVVQQTWGAPRRLRYQNIESVRYAVLRHFVQGMYSQTKLKLRLFGTCAGRPCKITFDGKHGERRVKLSFFKRTFAGGDELDALTNTISEMISQQLLGALRAGKGIRWGKALTISAEGLHRGELRLGLAEIQSVALNAGVIEVRRSDGKVFGKSSLFDENHLAGLLALHAMMTA